MTASATNQGGWKPSPEATAFAFGAMMHREYGTEWPRLIGIAAGAAMRAERDAIELKQDEPGGGE